MYPLETAHQQNPWMPVIALPRISAGESLVSGFGNIAIRVLTMDIALSFVRLSHKQIGDMPPDSVLIAHGISAKDLLESMYTVSTGGFFVEGQNLHASIDQRPVTVLPLDH